MTAESLHRFFNENIYSYHYRACLLSLNEAENVVSAIKGRIEPNEEFYYLRKTYGIIFLCLAGLSLGPIFIGLYILQLLVSAIICILAKVAETLCWLALQLIELTPSSSLTNQPPLGL